MNAKPIHRAATFFVGDLVVRRDGLWIAVDRQWGAFCEVAGVAAYDGGAFEKNKRVSDALLNNEWIVR